MSGACLAGVTSAHIHVTLETYEARDGEGAEARDAEGGR